MTRHLSPSKRRKIRRTVDAEFVGRQREMDPAHKWVTVEPRPLMHEDAPPAFQTPVEDGTPDIPRYRLIGWRDVAIAIVLTVLAVANWELWSIVLGS